jgi:predicted  nucleic acid-binding Zn-ribbon protein
MKEKKMNAEEKMQKVVELIGVVKSMQEETNERATRLEKDAAATTEKVTREMTSLRELVSSSSSSSSLDATVFSEIRDEMKKMREATEAFGRRLEKVEEELEELRNANAENVGGGGFEEDANSKRKNRNRTQQQQHSIDDRRRRLDDMYKKLEELN